MLTVGTGGLAQGAKQSATASKIATAASGTKIATAARVATSTYRGASAPARIAQQKLVSATVRTGSLTVTGAKTLYSGASTVGSAMRVRYHLARADVDLDALDETQLTRFGELTSTVDPAVARGLRRVDPDTRHQLLDLDDESVRESFFRAYGSRSVDDDVADQALQNYRGLDGDDRAFARDSIQRSDSDGIRLLGTELCNSPCDAVTARVNNLPDVVDGLDTHDAAKLQKALEDASKGARYDDDKAKTFVRAFEETGDSVSEGPGQNPSDVADNLKTLSDAGYDNFLDAGGQPESLYKGMAGEADIGTTLLERPGVDADDIEMNRRVPDVRGAPKGETEVDVDPKFEVTINGKTLDAPAIESKYRTSDSEFVIENEMLTGANPFVDQLETQIKADDVADELIVVFPEGYNSRLDELGIKKEIRDELDNRVNSDFTLEFSTYSELT